MESSRHHAKNSVFLEASFFWARRATNDFIVQGPFKPAAWAHVAVSWCNVAAHLDETLFAIIQVLLSTSTAHIVGATEDHLGGVAFLAVWKSNLGVVPGGHDFLWSASDVEAPVGSNVLPTVSVTVVSMRNTAIR